MCYLVDAYESNVKKKCCDNLACSWEEPASHPPRAGPGHRAPQNVRPSFRRPPRPPPLAGQALRRPPRQPPVATGNQTRQPKLSSRLGPLVPPPPWPFFLKFGDGVRRRPPPPRPPGNEINGIFPADPRPVEPPEI